MLDIKLIVRASRSGICRYLQNIADKFELDMRTDTAGDPLFRYKSRALERRDKLITIGDCDYLMIFEDYPEKS